MMTLRETIASVWVVGAVLFVGCLGDFHTRESRTAFALGILCGAIAFVVAGWAEKRA